MSALTRQSRCNGIWAPVELSYLTTAMSIVLAVVTIPGNLLVILAVAKSSHRDFRTTFMILVVNLAIADLQVGAVVEPLSVVTHIREALRLDIVLYQKAEHVSYFLSCSVSVLTLAALALDRFFAVSLPVWYRNNVTQKRVGVMVLLIWIFCICLTAVYFEIGFVAFLFVFANVAVVVTMMILLFSYLLTLRRAKMARKIFALDLASGEGNRVEGNTTRRKRVKREEKITKTFLIMLVFMLIFYLPSCVMMYMINLCKICSCVLIHWLRDIQFMFIWANSGVNPAVYALRLPRFRRAFLNLIRLNTGVGGDGSAEVSGFDAARSRVIQSVSRSRTESKRDSSD